MRPPPTIAPLSKDASRRIDALRFVLVLAIVVIHANGYSEEIRGMEFGPDRLGTSAWFLQEILSSVIARTAVPLFFLFSGLLTAGTLIRKGYGTLLKSRARTLLIPFVIWNVIAFSIYCAASPDKLSTTSPLSIFGFQGVPAAYHFWFVRDLILLVVFTPVSLAIARVAAWPSVALALVFWFHPPTGMGAGGAPIDPAAICFFHIGVVLCLRRAHFPTSWQAVGAIAYPALAVADALYSNDAPGGFVFHKAVLLLGMVTVWYVGGWLTRQRPIPAFLTGSAFMVYAAHEPLLGILKKLSYYVFRPDGDLSVTAIYLLTAAFTAGACIVANSLASRIAPRLHAIITGGRGLSATQH